MRSRTDSPTRGDVARTVEGHKQDMREKSREAEVVVNDLDVVRHTMDQLERGGTQEGSDEIERAIGEAKDVTVREYETKDQQLDSVQQKAEGDERQLTVRSDASESDKKKVSDASRTVDTKGTFRELDKAAEVVQRDVDFLREKIKAAGQNRAESDRGQEALRRRVYGNKSK